MSDSCTHTRRVWRESQIENWYTGEIESDGEWDVESTFEDIDLHRYHCTQCGDVRYYSSAARKFYEDGVESNITGLNKNETHNK